MFSFLMEKKGKTFLSTALLLPHFYKTHATIRKLITRMKINRITVLKIWNGVQPNTT